MIKLWTKMKEESAKFVAKFIIKGLFSVLSALVLFLAISIPKDAIRKVDPLAWFWLVVVLIIACIALVVYIFAKRPKYVFIPDVAIYKEKRTGNYFCSSCMANGKKSHLREYDNVWVCMTKDCNRKYYKRGKEPKPPQRGVISNGSSNGWVKNW